MLGSPLALVPNANHGSSMAPRIDAPFSPSEHLAVSGKRSLQTQNQG